MHFRYKYKHIECSECFDLQSEPDCPYQLCPHIIDHLDDLTRDLSFHTAVKNADSCGTFHRPTLLYLQREGLVP
jgi:hypothetical protein